MLSVMTTLTNEAAPRLRTIVVPLTVVCLSIYLLFTALVMEVYILVPIATLLFLIGTAPALRLLRRRP
jgi:hypothetical protein